jgi:hypothetical protein
MSTDLRSPTQPTESTRRRFESTRRRLPLTTRIAIALLIVAIASFLIGGMLGWYPMHSDDMAFAASAMAGARG